MLLLISAVFSRSPELFWTRRQFIIGRQRQTTLHTLTHTTAKIVSSQPRMLEYKDGTPWKNLFTQ